MCERDDHFQIVKRKSNRSKRQQTAKVEEIGYEIDKNIDLVHLKKKIYAAKLELISTDYYRSVLSAIKEAHTYVEPFRNIERIICFGLGHIGESLCAQYQLALLLCLQENFNTTALSTHLDVNVFDPAFGEIDIQILNMFAIFASKTNDEAKTDSQTKVTLFYLPHCPKELTNNLLWANWNMHSLNACIIMANSFTSIIEQSTKRILSSHAHFINLIQSHVAEIAIINCFKFYEVFNDINVHSFPINKLQLLPEFFWTTCSEPVYSEDSSEYISNKFHSIEH